MSDGHEQRDFTIDIPVPRDEALELLSEASEFWGATWDRHGTGGRLGLPVSAGVRRGRLTGPVWSEPAPQGTRLRFRVETSEYHLHWPAVWILLFGALGALATTLWPFYPPLLAIAPVAAVLALAAWFLVGARLRSAGPEEFLALLAEAEEEPEDPQIDAVSPE